MNASRRGQGPSRSTMVYPGMSGWSEAGIKS
jgi:hypothetical protein